MRRREKAKHTMTNCLGGEIGRHKGLKIPRLKGRAGSTPARGTIKNKGLPFFGKPFFMAEFFGRTLSAQSRENEAALNLVFHT